MSGAIAYYSLASFWTQTTDFWLGQTTNNTTVQISQSS